MDSSPLSPRMDSSRAVGVHYRQASTRRDKDSHRPGARRPLTKGIKVVYSGNVGPHVAGTRVGRAAGRGPAVYDRPLVARRGPTVGTLTLGPPAVTPRIATGHQLRPIPMERSAGGPSPRSRQAQTDRRADAQTHRRTDAPSRTMTPQPVRDGHMGRVCLQVRYGADGPVPTVRCRRGSCGRMTSSPLGCRPPGAGLARRDLARRSLAR